MISWPNIIIITAIYFICTKKDMSNLPMIVVILLCFNFVVGDSSTANNLNFNLWAQPYGTVTVLSATSVDLTFDSLGGSSVAAGSPQPAGTFCIDMNSSTVSGTVWSMRLTSADTLEQMEMEWWAPQTLNNEFSTNIWLNNNNLIANNVVTLPSGSNVQDSTYCMTWNLGGSAYWYVNSQLVTSHSLASFTKPFIPTIFTWGNLTAPWFLTQAGGAYKGVTAVSHIKNAYLSSVQENIGGIKAQPTAAPTSTLTLSPTVAVFGHNILNFNQWTKQYGTINVRSDNSLELMYNSLGGSSIAGSAQTAGTFCIDMNPSTAPGIVWSMRLTSADTLEQMEFEWWAPQTANYQLSVNLWNNTVNLFENNVVTVMFTYVQNSTYCMNWDLGGTANWYINGRLMKTHSIATFTKPLIPVLFTWGGLTQPWFITNAGGAYGGATEISRVTNAYLSKIQEVGPVTKIPTSLPTAVPTSNPSSTIPSVRPTHQPITTKPVPVSTTAPVVPSTTPSFRPTFTPNTAAPSTLSPNTDFLGVLSTSNTGSTSGSILAIIAALFLFAVICGFATYYYFCRKAGSANETKHHKKTLTALTGDEGGVELEEVDTSCAMPMSTKSHQDNTSLELVENKSKVNGYDSV